MPETPRKTNQFITWFTGILKETRRGDILEDKAAKATIDTDESLYPRLPSVDGSEIELRMTEARGLGDPPLSEFQIIMQRLEQMELGKRALQAVVGAVQKEEVKTKKEKNHMCRHGKIMQRRRGYGYKHMHQPREHCQSSRMQWFWGCAIVNSR